MQINSAKSIVCCSKVAELLLLFGDVIMEPISISANGRNLTGIRFRANGQRTTGWHPGQWTMSLFIERDSVLDVDRERGFVEDVNEREILVVGHVVEGMAEADIV